MNMALLLNDDLQKTIKRYQKLKKGMKPERFIAQCKLEEEKEPEQPINLSPPKPKPVEPVADIIDVSTPKQAHQEPDILPEPVAEKPKVDDLFSMDFGQTDNVPT